CFGVSTSSFEASPPKAVSTTAAALSQCKNLLSGDILILVLVSLLILVRNYLKLHRQRNSSLKALFFIRSPRVHYPSIRSESSLLRKFSERLTVQQDSLHMS